MYYVFFVFLDIFQAILRNKRQNRDTFSNVTSSKRIISQSNKKTER